jgi:hypothetical protein
VTYSQCGSSGGGDNASNPVEGLETDGRVYQPLTDVKTFSEKFDRLKTNNCGDEPSFNVLYALSSPKDYFKIGWRPDAHPYVIMVTDEATPGGDDSTSPPSVTADKIIRDNYAPCKIGDCSSRNSRMETYVITTARHQNEWGKLIYYDYAGRYVELTTKSGESAADYYFGALGRTVFSSICIAP